MKYVIIIMSALFVGSVCAQIPVNTQIWNGHNTIGFSSGINTASGDFNNDFVLSLTSDDQISQDVISDQAGKLSTSYLNRLGLDYETSIFASLPVSTSSHSLLIKLSDAAHVSILAPADAYSMVFEGNKSFVGDTLVVSDASALAMRYQKIGLGWQFTPSIGTSVYAVANFVNGEQLASLNIERGTVFTSELGDTLIGDFFASYAQSDTGSVGFASPNGSGFSVDFGMSTRLSAGNSEWDLSFDVVDLGRVFWQPGTIVSEIDTLVNWTGVGLPEVDEIDDTFTKNLSDSLSGSVNGLIGKSRYQNWLPGAFHTQILQSRPQGAEWGGGAVVRWHAGYNPFAYLLGGYQFNKFIDCHAVLGYGGFGDVQFGLQAKAMFDHLQAGLSIQNLEGWILPKSHLGASGRLSIQYLF